MRFRNKRYITSGINTRIPDELQYAMWLMVDEFPEVDYLQIFELQKVEGGIRIKHTQEEPLYEKDMIVICEADEDFKEKVYVIDDETHSTMLLAEEY